MRTLFAKILVWFVATVLLTSAGFVMVNRMAWRESGEGPPPGSLPPGSYLLRAFLFHSQEARRLYETGGRQALSQFLADLRRYHRIEAILTDREGIDLITGENRAPLLRVALRRAAPFLYGGRLVMAHRSEDGLYWFFQYAPDIWRPPLLQPGHLWLIACVLALSFLLARHLSYPLRNLQLAMERFGKGDLSVRARLARKDEIGKLAASFNAMADQVERLVTAQKRLLVDLSHELRSPLTRLGLAVELARTGEDRDQALDRIQREADRLNELVGGLLQVTRGESDPSTVRHEPLSLNDVLRGVADDCRLEADARRCRVDFHAQQELTIHGDVELLRRAIENVLRNAIRHSPPEAPVRVELDSTPEGARIRIRDLGPGVAPDKLPLLFEPFVRVEGEREATRQGFGLGLSIARRAVELHGGRIAAQNASPGLEVTITLPGRIPPPLAPGQPAGGSTGPAKPSGS